MLDAVPPKRDLGSSSGVARATIPPMPRAAFLCSVLGSGGVVVFFLGGYLLITGVPAISILSTNSTSRLVLLLIDAVGYLTSFVLSIIGFVGSVWWRKTGGRGWRNALSIVLAALGILIPAAYTLTSCGALCMAHNRA